MSRSTSAYRAWDARRSVEEQVETNLPPELHALSRLVGGAFRGSPDARAGALEEYADEHPGEALAAVLAEADAKLERLVAGRDRNRFRCWKCYRRAHARGLCPRHYREMRKEERR